MPLRRCTQGTIPALIDLCLDTLASHIHNCSSLASVPEELAQQLVERLVAQGGLSGALLRFLFDGLQCQLSELSFADCAAQVRDSWLQAVARQPLLESLTLAKCCGLRPAGLKALTKLPNLRQLDLSHCSFVGSVAMHHIGHMLSLERLVLRSCDGLADQHLLPLSALRRLRLLRLSDCVRLTERCVVPLQPLAPVLEVLFLDGIVQLDDKALVPFLRHCTALTTLDVGRTGCGPGVLAALAPLGPHQLVRLGLASCTAVKSGLLLRTLPTLSAVTHLTLDQHCWTSCGPADAAAAFLSLHMLQRLYLRMCPGLTDELLQAVLRVAGRRLLTLSVTGCAQLSDAVLAAARVYCPLLGELHAASIPANGDSLLVAASHLSSLVSLDLSDCGAVPAISFLALLRLRSLEVLRLRWTSIGDREVAELIAGLPALRVLDLSSCLAITQECLTIFSTAPSLQELVLENNTAFQQASRVDLQRQLGMRVLL